MAATSLRLVVDVANNRLLESVSSASSAPTPSFAQGDIIAVELHLVSGVASLSSAAVEAPIPSTSTVRVGVGIPGSTPAALASLPTPLSGNLGRSGTLSLNTAEIASLLGGATSKPATLEVEIVDADGSVSTVFQGSCTVLNDLISEGGAQPQQLPSLAVDVAALKADLDALRGGVPLTGWANSTAYPFDVCTITGGIPTALEFAGVTDDFAYAELALTDFAPDTLDISGTVSAGTVELTDLSLVFLDGAGAEAGTIGALTLGAAFSFASVVVPSGAVKVAVKALGTAATSSLSAGFSALSVTAHANLSELTAEALDDILAAKAQAESDAGTVAALVTPAQTNAQTVADLVAPAQADAAAAGTAKDNAESYAASAYTAMLNAGNSNKVGTDDPRLAVLGGVQSSGSVGTQRFFGFNYTTPVLMDCDREFWFLIKPTLLAWDTAKSGMILGSGSLSSVTQTATDWGVAVNDTKVRLTTGATGSESHATLTYAPSAQYAVRWFGLKFVSSTGAVSYSFSPANPSWVSLGTLPSPPAPARWFGSGRSSVPGFFGGSIFRAFHTNVLLSDADRAEVVAHGPTDDLAEAHKLHPASFWSSSSFLSFSALSLSTGDSVGAFTMTVNMNDGGGINGSHSLVPTCCGLFRVTPGMRFRVRGTLTKNSGSSGALPKVCCVSAGVLQGTPVTIPEGAFDVTYTASAIPGIGSSADGPSDCDFAIVHSQYLSNDGAVNYTLTNCTIECLGVEAHYTPDRVTRTAMGWAGGYGSRWVDLSRSCNDLRLRRGYSARAPRTVSRLYMVRCAGQSIPANSVQQVSLRNTDTDTCHRPFIAARRHDHFSVAPAEVMPASLGGLVATANTENAAPVIFTPAPTAATIAAGQPLLINQTIG